MSIFTGIKQDEYLPLLAKDEVRIGQDVEGISGSFSTIGEDCSATFRLKIGPYYTNDRMLTAADIMSLKNLVYVWLKNERMLQYEFVNEGISAHATVPVREKLTLSSIKIDQLDGTTDFWVATCEYAKHKLSLDSDVQQLNFHVNIVQRTAHITQSLETMVQKPAAPGYYPRNFGGSIGYNDGVFEGCDIITSKMTISQEKWIPFGQASMEMMRNISRCVGCINVFPFYGFRPREVLFTGVSEGARTSLTAGNRTVWFWAMTYNFECCPSEDALEVGASGPFYKAGYDYAWTLREKTMGLNSMGERCTVTIPVQVNVERVYPLADFCLLGLEELIPAF